MFLDMYIARTYVHIMCFMKVWIKIGERWNNQARYTLQKENKIIDKATKFYCKRVKSGTLSTRKIIFDISAIFCQILFNVCTWEEFSAYYRLTVFLFVRVPYEMKIIFFQIDFSRSKHVLTFREDR